VAAAVVVARAICSAMLGGAGASGTGRSYVRPPRGLRGGVRGWLETRVVNPSDGEPVLVRCIDCVAQQGHDVLDWLAALGGAIGGVAALVALIFAWRSERHAKASAEHAAHSQELAERSANAAEAELELFRGEVKEARRERSRRAQLRFELHAAVTSWLDTRPHRLKLWLGYANTGSIPVVAFTREPRTIGALGACGHLVAGARCPRCVPRASAAGTPARD
jgi:hypothetical protein